MKDLMQFKNDRIDSLMKRVAELEKKNYQYATWLLEVCDVDCPQEFRDVVDQDVRDNY